jgi:hypothetical protein
MQDTKSTLRLLVCIMINGRLRLGPLLPQTLTTAAAITLRLGLSLLCTTMVRGGVI